MKIRYRNSLREIKHKENLIEFLLRCFQNKAFDSEKIVSWPERWLYFKQKVGLKKIRKPDATRLLINGILDPNGLGMLELMLYNSYVPYHYYFMFYELPYFIERNSCGGGGDSLY